MTAATIAAALGDARREGHAWRCRCPLHGGRSLTLRDGEGGRVLVTCWGGCDRRDVIAELCARGLLGKRPDYQCRIPAPRQADDDDDARRIMRARRIWDGTLPAIDSPAAQYLARRGIELDPWPASLRWHPNCPRPDGKRMPAMVAVVEHVTRGVIGIHRTYLTPDFRRHDRATRGLIGGGAVWLGTPRAGEWLAIGEGIETTASVASACAMAGWAALSAGGIRSLILPSAATHVAIIADHDASGVGARAAHDAAARWLAEGRRVRIAIPPESDTDFNDVLLGKSSAITEAQDVG